MRQNAFATPHNTSFERANTLRVLAAQLDIRWVRGKPLRR